MKDINRLSILEIAERFGWANGISYAVDSRLVPQEKREEVEKLMYDYAEIFSEVGSSLVDSMDPKQMDRLNEARAILIELEPYIDKKKYLYQAYVNQVIFVKKIEAGEIPFGSVNSATFETTKKMLRDEKEYLENADLLMEQDIRFPAGSDRAQLITSDDVIGNPENKKGLCSKAKRRFSEFDATIPMDTLLFFLGAHSLIHICRYPELGDVLRERTYKKYCEKYPKEEDVSVDTNEKVSYLRKKGVEIIKANIEYFNIDKLSVFALNDWKKLLQDTKIEGDEYANMDKGLISHWLEVAKVLRFLIPRNRQNYTNNIIGEEINLEKMIAEMEQCMSRFINGKYSKQEEVDAMRQKLLNGEVSCRSILPEEYKDTMHFTPEELITILSHNMKDIKYFTDVDIISDKDIEHLEQYTDSQYIISLYLKKNNSGEDYAKFEEALRIYKFLMFEGRTDEEKNDLGLEAIDKGIDIEDEETLRELYQYGIITVDNLIGLIGNTALREFIEQGKLKPIDVRRLIENKTFSMDEFKKVIAESEISPEEKLVLIYSTFPNPEEREIRDSLLASLYKQVEKAEKTTDTDGGGKVPNPPIPGPKRKEFVYDPCTKWQLLSELDSEYFEEYFQDGHIVFYLPSKGEYIIEKLFDPTTRSDRPPYAYGAATYIIDEKVFDAEKDSIIVDGKINRHFLAEKYADKEKRNGITKIIHKGWANGICRHFDVDNPSRYTEEQAKKIHKLADTVENSREERN